MAETKVASKPKGRSKLLVISALVLVLAGSLFFLSRQGYMGFLGVVGTSHGPSGQGEKQATIGTVHVDDLGVFTVNLADPGYHRYLRCEIAVEYLNPDTGTELKDKSPRVRDAVLRVLRSKTSSQLGPGSSTEQLRKELIATVNQELSVGKISGLYFKEFIIQ